MNKFSPLFALPMWRSLACALALASAFSLVAQDTIPANADKAVEISHASQLGAVTAIQAEQFNKGFIHNPLQLAQGRVAGLMIARPGGDPNGYFQSRLRGLHTLNEGYAEPLIVIDGLPQASLLGIAPEDVASITVLKDAASAARYGLRGGAGVVLIQTRQFQDKGWQVRYRGAVSVESVTQTPNMLSADEYRDIYNNPSSPFFNRGLNSGASTNWIQEITRRGLGHWHQLDMGYGGSRRSYRLALHFREANGIVRRSGYDQFNGQFSVAQRLLKDRLQLSAQLGYTHRRGQHIVPDVIRQAIAFNPTAPVRSDTALSTGGYAQVRAFQMANPVALLEQPLNESRQDVATANLHGDWQIAQGLRFSGRLAAQQYDGLNGFVAPVNEWVFGLENGGLAQRYTDKALNLFAHAQLSYALSLGQQRLALIGGYTRQHLTFDTELREGRQWLIPNFGYNDLLFEGRYLDSRKSAAKENHQLAGFWGEAQLDMSNGMQFSAMLRREGSSRLGKNAQWQWLPAFQIGWDMRGLLGAEPWDALRLRSSYGWAGNVPQNSLRALLNWRTVGQFFYYNGEYVPYFVPNFYGNSNLGAEIRREWNLGFDWALPDRRVFASADYYLSRSQGLIRMVTLRSEISGVGEYAQQLFDNVAQLRNTGLELQLGATLANRHNFRWTVEANAFWYRTRTGKLNRPLYAPQAFTGYGLVGYTGATDFVFRLEENSDFAKLWGLSLEAVNEAGFWEFQDISRNGVIDDGDKRPLANALPPVAAGLSSRVEWGRFDVQVFLRGLLGHSKVDFTRTVSSSRNTLPHFNLNRDIYDDPLSRLRSFSFYSDFFVKKASFVRLDNLVLGYTLPARQGKALPGWRFYAAAQNLLTLGSYRFNDPEPYLATEQLTFKPSTGVLQGRYGVPAFHNFQPGPEPESGTYFPSRVWVLGLEARF